MKFIVGTTGSIEQLGGKAGALAKLEGFPIPEWIALMPAAFEDSQPPNPPRVGDFRASLQSPPLVGDLGGFPTVLHPTIQAELTAALTKLCPNGERVAVRSSALDEDGDRSFAGQLESFLFVPIDQVADRILDVWRSAFSDRIVAYREEHNLPPATAPAVLIQKMVDAEVAGVAFSAHPVTGQRGVAIVSAVYGLGSALVGGEVDADTYEVDRAGNITSRQIARKEIAHRSSENGVVTEAIDPVLAEQPALTDAQVQEIARLAREVEQRLNCPQDIEWAIAQGKLYLLQARPITTLAQLPDPDGTRILWDNSNISESYGGITTPLTFSFVRRAYAEVYRQFCRMMGVSEGAIASHDTTFRCLLGLIRGRIYYNLINWYRLLALLPGFKMNQRFMEQMMGVREPLPPDVLATLEKATWRDRFQDSLSFLNTLRGLVVNFATLPKQIRHFYKRLDSALAEIDLTVMRPDELVAHYYDLERQLLTRWDAPIVNDFFAMIFYGLLRSLCVKWCNDSGTLQNDLIGGEGGMISAEPAKRIRELAITASQSPNFAELLCSGSLPQITAELENQPQFQTQYRDYLDRFGDRCLEELKLESPTLHDNPMMLLRSIGQLARQPITKSAPTVSPRQQAEAKVAQLIRNPIRRWVFDRVLHQARARVRDRENLRFERTRLFGRVRRIVVELGRRLWAIDAINSPQDVFYLELPELLGYIDGTTTTTDLKGLIALRQAEFAQYETSAVPGDRFETHGTVNHAHDFQPSTPTRSIAAEGSDRTGIGCCPGIIRAPVQIITDPKTAVLRPGSILVAKQTDPGWILLFPGAAGVLVERGGVLSHAAIVARELNLPAIVSLPGLLDWLQDGDRVEMNGSTGQVRRLIEVEPAREIALTGGEA
ncbi:MAG: phosphoenolpyruvate synthase [Leptolyngbyaceae cyanobacterium SM1_3_5]|nr:phosphoenolpyruvate synthase [Leptolyngbyaceae cyanobacterium SM1_3_5]